MKKVFSLLLILMLCCTMLPAGVLAADEDVTINVYNWGQYIADGSDGYIDVNAAFTEATGIKVNYLTYDSNETMYTKLKTGGSSYDVIIPSDYMIARLIAEDMLEPLNFENIPNYQYIDEAYRNTDYDPDNIYSVPYTWGTVGVIYNTKYVDEADIGSWDLLWNEKYADKILMFNNPRDAFAIAEFSLGLSINTHDPAELQAAADLLVEQKGVVQQYVMDQIFNAMEREEAWIAPYYAGDYLLMLEENEALGFYFPEEGFNLFIDAMCIPKGCQNKDAAEAYINFLCDPEICGQNLEYLGYSTPSTASKEFMDPEVTESDVAYPSEEILAGGSNFSYLETDTNQLMDQLWLTVKTEGGVSPFVVIAVIGIIAAAAIFVQVRKRMRRARRARRAKYRAERQNNK